MNKQINSVGLVSLRRGCLSEEGVLCVTLCLSEEGVGLVSLYQQCVCLSPQCYCPCTLLLFGWGPTTVVAVIDCCVWLHAWPYQTKVLDGGG